MNTPSISQTIVYLEECLTLTIKHFLERKKYLNCAEGYVTDCIFMMNLLLSVKVIIRDRMHHSSSTFYEIQQKTNLNKSKRNNPIFSNCLK